jgi:hypothetical protein
MAHGDFYFAINATFYHFSERWGEEGLIKYWETMGREYLAPLAEQFQAGGPEAIAKYWADYFAGEPGGDVDVSQSDGRTVLIDVKDCPAIRWLKKSPGAKVHVETHPMYCQHCHYINSAMMETTDYEFKLEGGGGSCQQTFSRREGKA